VKHLLTIEVGSRLGLRVLERAVEEFTAAPEKYGEDRESNWIVFQVLVLPGGGFAAMLRQLLFDEPNP
jgi:hypothetical protein